MEKRQPPATALPLQIADMEIRTILDSAFAGEFMLTPVLHSHPFYELQCVLDGEYFIGFSNGSALPMKTHSLCILPPGLYHRTYTETSPVRKLAVQFDYHRTHFIKDSIYKTFHRALSAVKVPIIIEGADVCELMEKIRGELRTRAVAAEEMRQSLMCEMYITVLRRLRAENSNESPSEEADSREIRYMQIEAFFAAHYNHPITAYNLAEEIGLSRRQTDRIVAEIYGMTFREKLIELRMTQAIHLLTTTDLPVETVAEQIGYRSLSGFFVAFRSRFGTGASEYRRSLASTFDNKTSFS